MSELVRIITATAPEERNRALDSFCLGAPAAALLAECEALDELRRSSPNLYERVRALFFLAAIHRFHLPGREGVAETALLPYSGYAHLLARRYEEAIRAFQAAQEADGPSAPVSSALAAAYRGLAFQTLADQVRRSVRAVRGNQWMFRAGHPGDYPLRVRPELLRREGGLFPVLRETTPVRMDLSHSGWSDIFFLGMDFPEGARVLNISIDLCIHGHGEPAPPVEAWLRVIDRPVLRLASTDLRAEAEITSLAEVFDFARDYLGLLKAAVIASGIVPPGMEGSGQPLESLLARLTGAPGLGLEIVSKVNDIPKGSRLAVSTNLLACLISAGMRATGQINALTGPLEEDDRRLVAARAILGEWLGGSGGGWQDSGGVWPGIKLITGERAAEGDVEYGVSRGRLLPRHHLFGPEAVSPATRELLQNSLVLVHGGMAQDVGPILEMVTERYLLRSQQEWLGRQEAISLLDQITAKLKEGDVRALGGLTQRNYDSPIQTIIPWAGNHYTAQLIAQARAEFGAQFWGFWMLGGMAGGGMGFLFDPAVQPRAKQRLGEIMSATRRRLEGGVPFAMEPVVYDFRINERGSVAELRTGADALMPPPYYTLRVPALLRREQRSLSPAQHAELERFGDACRHEPALRGMTAELIDHLLPQSQDGAGSAPRGLRALLDELGFDAAHHEKIRGELRAQLREVGQEPWQSRVTPTHLVELLGLLADRTRTSVNTRSTTPARNCPRGCAPWASRRWRKAPWPWSRWRAAPGAAGRTARGWSRR